MTSTEAIDAMAAKLADSPAFVFWVPGMDFPREIITDCGGKMQVAMDRVREARNLLETGFVETALHLLNEVVADLPVLPSFHIV